VIPMILFMNISYAWKNYKLLIWVQSSLLIKFLQAIDLAKIILPPIATHLTAELIASHQWNRLRPEPFHGLCFVCTSDR
ncbi:MAG: hypothetical protein ACO3EZ_15210, partial [Prochlorotrichaceae cyanobacterium]